MSDFIALLNALLAFLKETVGHPDPKKRTSVFKLFTVFFLIALTMFFYNYGGVIIDAHRVDDIKAENLALRTDLGRMEREHDACRVQLTETSQQLSDLLDAVEARNTPPTEIGSGLNQDILDRLERLQ